MWRMPGSLLGWLVGCLLGLGVLLTLISVVVDWSCCTGCASAKLPVGGVAAGGMGATVVPVHYHRPSQTIIDY